MIRRPRAGRDFEAVRTAIGMALRSLHSEVLHEPLPDRIAELLRQLDQQIGQLDQDADEP
jgi:Anti-sigma factor NepR